MLNNLMAYLTVAIMDLRKREEGQTLVEYALIIGIVSIFLIAALTFLRTGIANIYSDISSKL